MRIKPGVETVEPYFHDLVVSKLVQPDPSLVVYVIDTFSRPEIDSSEDLVRAVAMSTGVSEWYGYDLATILIGAVHQAQAQAQAQVPTPSGAPGIRSLLVITLSPGHRHLLTGELIDSLSSATLRAASMGLIFETMLFEQPLFAVSPRA